MTPRSRNPDHLGTPRQITDASNKIVWRWDNAEPFGANQPDGDPDADGVLFEFNLRFPGQYFDRETGRHYNYFRDYDPGTGRYAQFDRIRLRGGINGFAYVRNNPISRSDRFGLFEDGKRYYADEHNIPVDQVPDTIPWGHSDMYGGNILDFTKEDHSWWSRPEVAPWRHFRPIDDVIPEVEAAIASCNQDEFERKMHQLHDNFSHYAKGYRWGSNDPNTPCGAVGHLCDLNPRDNPDYDKGAWDEANRAQRDYADRFAKKRGVCGELR